MDIAGIAQVKEMIILGPVVRMSSSQVIIMFLSQCQFHNLCNLESEDSYYLFQETIILSVATCNNSSSATVSSADARPTDTLSAS